MLVGDVIRLFAVVVVLFMTTGAVAGSARAVRDRPSAYSALFSACHDLCHGGNSPDERVNCVSKCVSPDCFEKIYGKQPLEDGEIDEVRKNRYNSCISAERRTGRYERDWKGENNVSEQERSLRDSQWQAKQS